LCTTAKHYKNLFREFKSHIWQGVLDTTLCDKVCQWLATGQWLSPSTLVSSTNKTDQYNITEILLKVALNTINQTEPYSLRLSTSLKPGYQMFKGSLPQSVMRLVNVTGKTWYKILHQLTMYVISLSNISIKTNFK
jgi:hypothetical protein